MHGSHFIFEVLAFVVDCLHFFAVDVCKTVCSSAGIFCVVCRLHILPWRSPSADGAGRAHDHPLPGGAVPHAAWDFLQPFTRGALHPATAEEPFVKGSPGEPIFINTPLVVPPCRRSSLHRPAAFEALHRAVPQEVFLTLPQRSPLSCGHAGALPRAGPEEPLIAASLRIPSLHHLWRSPASSRPQSRPR